jgi:ubiquinone/menaquinone biosynthesis C-methylase UbiE
MGTANLGHYVLGLEGVALLRTWLSGDQARSAARVEEIRQVVDRPAAPPLAVSIQVPEVDFQAGYAAWSANYDALPNPLIRCEEPALRGLIERIPTGRALDAACGTGRHTAYLHARGHRVIGVDGSAAMLAQARARLPDVEFREGDLTALPLDSGSMDLAVCALALAHFPDLLPPLREIARVTRPGGRVLLSDQHPLQVALGGQAFFVAADGSSAFVRNHFHTHAAYLKAFAQAGLEVLDCLEPASGPEEIDLLIELTAAAGLKIAPEAVRDALLGLPTALLWELGRRA